MQFGPLSGLTANLMLRAPGSPAKLLKLRFQQRFRRGPSFWITINQAEMELGSLSNTLPYLTYAIERWVDPPQHHLRFAVVHVLGRELGGAIGPMVHRKYPEIDQLGIWQKLEPSPSLRVTLDFFETFMLQQSF